MKIVKTWCESTLEGQNYLKHNGYGTVAKRIFKTNFFLCIGGNSNNTCTDVKVIFAV